MMRVVLEGKDAEEYLNLRKRNAELAQTVMEKTKKIMQLQKELRGQPKPQVTIMCDPDGNVVDVQEEAPRKRFGFF